MCINDLLGLERFISFSIACPLLNVASPISILPVAAISNLQNSSLPQILVASSSRLGSVNTASYVGVNDGS